MIPHIDGSVPSHLSSCQTNSNMQVRYSPPRIQARIHGLLCSRLEGWVDAGGVGGWLLVGSRVGF